MVDSAGSPPSCTGDLERGAVGGMALRRALEERRMGRLLADGRWRDSPVGAVELGQGELALLVCTPGDP